MKKRTGKDRLKKYAFGGGTEDPKPKPPVYKTQEEVDAANTFARQFANRRYGNANMVINPDSVMAAYKPGDPVVQFYDNSGKNITGVPANNKRLPLSLPSGISPNDVLSDGSAYWYNDPHTGDSVSVDPSVVLSKKKFASGGTADGSNDTDWSGIAGMANAGLGSLSQIMNVLSTPTPSDYSNQPIVNRSTLKGMSVNNGKFAMGGEAGDSSGGNDLLDELQALADEQGIDVQELIQNLQSGSDNSNDDNSSQGTEEGTDNAEEQDEDETNDDDDTSQSDDEYAFGGSVGNVGINAEGGEVAQTPDGQVKAIQGPKHESGGVNLNVPKGTKIYSERLKVDGKTMAERKVGRERAMQRLQKNLSKNPGDPLLKATLKRTQENHAVEEQHDMTIQNALNKLQNGQKFAYGGNTDGDEGGINDLGYGNYMNSKYKGNSSYNFLGNDTTEGLTAPMGQYFYTPDAIDHLEPSHPQFNTPAPTLNRGTSPTIDFMGSSSNSSSKQKGSNNNGLTTGDYIGLGGNVFGAIAPILNTMNEKAATNPNINRYRGYGRDAMAANDKAQDYINDQTAASMGDISDETNTAFARNRNGASSVNTVRALDAATTMGANKARAAARAAKAGAMSTVLGQRSSIALNKDRIEMAGESQRDVQNKMDTDNYYSNNANNIANFATNVEGVGRALNINHANKVNTKLISQLSKYGLTFDEDGNLISGKK